MTAKKKKAAKRKKMTFRKILPPKSISRIKRALSRLPRRYLAASAFILIFAIAGVMLLFFSHADLAQGTIYRLYNPNNGDHYYTANYAEEQAVIQYFGYHLEATYYNAYEQGQPATPVYRLRNPNGHHFLTDSYTEAQQAIQYGWVMDTTDGTGIVWYTYASGLPPAGFCRQSWYRLVASNGDHFFSPSVQDASSAQQYGYTLESGNAFTTDVPCSASSAVGTTLSTNQTLYSNQSLLSTGLSSNGSGYTVLMQADGNLVVYNNVTAKPTWSTGTSGANNHLIMQADGNLVIYNTSGGPVWSSGTPGRGSTDSLIMQPDGNLAIYNGTTAVWSIWTGVIVPPVAPYVLSSARLPSAYLHFAASPTAVHTGQTTTLRWVAKNYGYCSSYGNGWGGKVSSSGSFTTPSFKTAGTYTYRLTCAYIPPPGKATSNGPIQRQVVITVTAPSTPLPAPAGALPPNVPSASIGLNTSTNSPTDVLNQINAARASETPPVKAMNLNLAAFNSLTIPQQLFVVSNLERIDRGLPPAVALTNQLNVAAQGGADNPGGADPVLPNDVNTPITGSPSAAISSLGSNWVGGSFLTALGADYIWMYDDGFGSNNLDCPAANTPSPPCWGHRINILSDYSDSGSSLYMGAANNPTGWLYQGNYYPAYATIYVGIYGGTPSDITFTWAKAKQILGL